MSSEETPSPGSSDVPESSRAEAIRDPVTYEIIGAAQRVHGILGPGFTESTYQAALERELSMRRVAFESQKQFEVRYEKTVCGTYIPDLVVAQEVVVELKAVDEFAAAHLAQAISYLKASGLRKGLLINFGAPSLQVRRMAN
jgi:GxxExxY protein